MTQTLENPADAPLVVHQYTDQAGVPAAAARPLGPPYEHRLWTAEAAAQLVRQQLGAAIASEYESCSDRALRANLLRDLALYAIGGIFVSSSLDLQGAQPIAPRSANHGRALAASLNAIAACNAASNAPNLTRNFRWTGTVFLGHPRCGSAALAAALSAGGLAAKHEAYAPDCIVSWWHTGFAKTGQAHTYFASTNAKAARQEVLLSGQLGHYLRNPKDAIPSIVLENEANERRNNSFNFRRRVLKRRFDIDLSELDPAAAAATSYALWNRRAGELAGTEAIKVEAPDLSRLFPGRAFPPLPRKNTSERKFRTQTKPAIDLSMIQSAVPGEARPWLEAYLDLYEIRRG